MNDIVEQVTTVVKKNRIKILTCAEVSHFSVTSHDLHYKLLQSLLENGLITTFSSEGLGVIDALLMNAWIQGRIDVSIDHLYRRVLPCGGLGTYRWLLYLRRTKHPFRLIGTECDPDTNVETYKYLRGLLSDDFYPALGKIINEPKITTYFVKQLPKFIRTRDDRDVYKSIRDSYTWHTNRLKFWYARINNAVRRYGSLFINGFHLSCDLSEFGSWFRLHERRGVRAMSIGMASFNKELTYCKLNSSWFKKYQVDIADLKYRPDFFFQVFREYVYKHYKYDDWFKHVTMINRYYEPTELEKNIADFI